VSHLRLIATCIGALLVAERAGSAAGGFVFVRNAKNDTAQIGKEELKDCYTGKKKSWKNGTPVEIALNAGGSAELKWVASELIGASDDILLAKIKQEVFKGEMKKPTAVASSQDCLAEVKKAAGAVCAVDADTAKSLPDGVAILDVK